MITHKITTEALRLLRLIAAMTGERQWKVLERLLAAEWERVKRDQDSERAGS